MSNFDYLFQENKSYGSKNHLHSSSDAHKSQIRNKYLFICALILVVYLVLIHNLLVLNENWNYVESISNYS
jgi:hypothetical protein